MTSAEKIIISVELPVNTVKMGIKLNLAHNLVM
jgi:hypothetical protein